MSGTIDDRYFEWLYSLIGAVRNRNPARSYWGLTRQLYVKEFVWIVPNDDNRVEDGKDLRREFIEQNGLDPDQIDPTWMNLGCSMLEMLIALGRRASFESEGKTSGDWFWMMINNLDLRRFNDERYDDEGAQIIDETLDCVIYRNYSYDGSGGLFPLKDPIIDQRKVELWYQLAEYLLEGYPP